MAYTIDQISEDPIVIVIKVWGAYNNAEAAATSREVEAMVGEAPGPIYRISDATELAWNWDQMEESFSHHVRHQPGSISDPRMVPVIVGGGRLGEVYQTGMAADAFGNVQVHLFETMDDVYAALENGDI